MSPEELRDAIAISIHPKAWSMGPGEAGCRCYENADTMLGVLRAHPEAVFALLGGEPRSVPLPIWSRCDPLTIPRDGYETVWTFPPVSEEPQ